MFNSIHLVHYHKETRIAFDNVMIITVESGKKLNEMGLRLKSTHHYYVITTNITIFILMQKSGLSHLIINPSSTQQGATLCKGFYHNSVVY